jgi:hypothetical protein
MLVELPARGVRVGGVTVAPGEARAVAIALAPRARAGKQALPSIPAVGRGRAKSQDRVVSVVARGSRRRGDRGARGGQARGQPRPGGADRQRGGGAGVAGARAAGARQCPGGRAVAVSRDATGGRGARDAFTLFSDIVIGASALIVLAGPLRARRGAVVARGRLTDPRVRRLARQSGAVAILPSPAKSHDLLAAGAAAGVPGLELSAAALPDADGVSDALAEAARATMAAVGVLGKGSERLPAPAADAEPGAGPVVAIRPVRVRADSDGFLETDVVPGAVLRARAALGRVVPALPGPSSPVLASTDGLVIEASPPGPVRAGSTLFMLLPLAEQGGAAARARQQGVPAASRRRRRPATRRRASAGSNTSRSRGWAWIGSRPRSTPARAPAPCTSRACAPSTRRAAHTGGPSWRSPCRAAAAGGGRTVCAPPCTGSRWCATPRGARSGGR